MIIFCCPLQLKLFWLHFRFPCKLSSVWQSVWQSGSCSVWCTSVSTYFSYCCKEQRFPMNPVLPWGQMPLPFSTHCASCQVTPCTRSLAAPGLKGDVSEDTQVPQCRCTRCGQAGLGAAALCPSYPTHTGTAPQVGCGSSAFQTPTSSSTWLEFLSSHEDTEAPFSNLDFRNVNWCTKPTHF